MYEKQENFKLSTNSMQTLSVKYPFYSQKESNILLRLNYNCMHSII